MKSVNYTQGCAMTLYIPAKLLTGSEVLDVEPDKFSNLSGFVSLHGAKTTIVPEVVDGALAFELPHTLTAGAYTIGYSFKYDGIENAGQIAGKLNIVKDNAQSNWGLLITDGSASLDDQIYIAGRLVSDEELEQLKAQARAAKAEAEAAKALADAARETLTEKAVALEGAAKESTSVSIFGKLTDLYSYVAGRFDTLTSYCATRFDSLYTSLVNGFLSAILGNTNTIKDTQNTYEYNASQRALQTQGVVNSQAAAIARQIEGEVSDRLGIIGVPATMKVRLKINGAVQSYNYIGDVQETPLGTAYSWEVASSGRVVYCLNETPKAGDKVYSSDGIVPITQMAEEGTVTEVTITRTGDLATEALDAKAKLTALQTQVGQISASQYKGILPHDATTDNVALPNSWNQWGTISSAVTITKGAEIAGVVNEYCIRLACGDGASVTLSGWTDLAWNGGSAPSWTSGKHYEISIIDNLAVFVEV